VPQDSIAERKRTEHALAALGESEAIYRATFDEAPVGIGLTDLTGRFLRVNRRLCELLGVSADALLSSTFLDLTHPDDRSDDAGARDRLLDGTLGRYVGEKRYRHADGRYVWVAISVNLQRNASGEPLYFLATVEDISARRAAEDRSRSASAHLRAVVSALPLALWSLDRRGIVTLSEGRLLEKLGFLPGQLVGQSQFELYAADSQVIDWTRRALAGETLHDTNEVGGIVFETWYSPIRAVDGGVSGTIGVAIDVTERVRLDEELRQTQKMEAIGRLAGGIAHDFNNLLTAITGYAEVALEANRPAGDARADIEEILRASQMASALTRQLLAFSRRQVPQFAAIDVNVIVGRMDGLLRRLIGDDVELRTNLCEAGECVRADAGQIEQVIMNLALNARDAMPAGGCLTVETRVVALDDEFVALHHGASVGPHVMLTVSDTGVGMTEASRRRVFEPFFTTKEQGKGTGLGLSTVYGIVKHSGGSVWAASEPGRGTTITVYLPVVAAAPAAERPPVATPLKIEGTETVLVAEDQDAVRTIICKTLQRHGYVVIDAAHPRDALAISRQDDRPIDLLLTDVVMPGMSGLELARTLQAERRSLRVLFTSGYTNHTVVESGEAGDDAEFIQKPFSPRALLEKVRLVLDARHQERPLEI
jgi:PAS domain S-box-containing protein